MYNTNNIIADRDAKENMRKQKQVDTLSICFRPYEY